jgi:hypothetical protein
MMPTDQGNMEMIERCRSSVRFFRNNQCLLGPRRAVRKERCEGLAVGAAVVEAELSEVHE